MSIVTLRPEPGTVPANETLPDAGAATGSPSAPETSMPRCWPAAYGWAWSNENGWTTAPPVGQVQAAAVSASTRLAKTSTVGTTAKA